MRAVVTNQHQLSMALIVNFAARQISLTLYQKLQRLLVSLETVRAIVATLR